MACKNGKHKIGVKPTRKTKVKKKKTIKVSPTRKTYVQKKK